VVGLQDWDVLEHPSPEKKKRNTEPRVFLSKKDLFTVPQVKYVPCPEVSVLALLGAM
jgi:hypothetical protein